MKEIFLSDIFKVFFKIGIVLLGGGYVIIPIMQDELIKKRKWIKNDELLDYYCVSQCLPGIIAVNMAILIGCKLKGVKGAIVSLFAMALSPFISIILIAGLIGQIMHLPFIKGIFWGINLSVIILIYLTLKEMWKKSIVDYITLFWFLLILVFSLVEKSSPVILIISSILLGITVQILKDNKDVQ